MRRSTDFLCILSRQKNGLPHIEVIAPDGSRMEIPAKDFAEIAKSFMGITELQATMIRGTETLYSEERGTQNQGFSDEISLQELMEELARRGNPFA